MINKQVTLTITGDNQNAELSTPITVYRGDGNINIQLTLAQEVYQYGRRMTRSVLIEGDYVTNVDVEIVRPKGNSYFKLDSVELVDNQFNITLDKTWVDEVEEIGTYHLQINTYDGEGNQATLPSFPIEVLPRLTDSVPQVKIGDLIESGAISSDKSYVTSVGGQAVEVPFWVDGEAVTVERMNEQLQIIKDNDQRINITLDNCDDLLQETRQFKEECERIVNEVYSTTLRYRIVE